MKKFYHILGAILFFTGIILAIVIPLHYRLTHIDTTETRIFIENLAPICIVVFLIIVGQRLHLKNI